MSKVLSALKPALQMSRLLRPYWKRVAVIVVFSLVSVAVGLLNPIIAKFLLDRSFMHREIGSFVTLTCIGAGLFVINLVVMCSRSYCERLLKMLLHFRLSKDVFAALAAMPFSYFQDRSQGEHLHRLNYDVEMVSDFLATKVVSILAQTVKVILAVGILFFLSWQITVLALLAAPVIFLCPGYFRKKRLKLWEELYKGWEGSFQRVAEFFLHIKLVKAFAKELHEVKLFVSSRAVFTRGSVKNARIEQVEEVVITSLVKLLTGALTVWAGYMVVRGAISIGTLGAITMYLNQVMDFQIECAKSYDALMLSSCSFHEISCIKDGVPASAKGSRVIEVVPVSATIEVSGVSFGYRQEVPLFSGVSMSIPAGSRVALAGRSGCGKTTFLYLLLKLYSPWSGSLRYGVTDVRDISSRDLAAGVAVAFREPHLWNDTVINNIGYALAHPVRQEVERVARHCLVDEIVRDMPRGYDTVIGEEACKISDGQKQKIALARALIKKPAVLILDEAMASMDSQSEEQIMRTIHAEYPGMTVLTVSHRFSTVMAAEKVIFFKNTGELVAASAPELLRTEAAFAELFASQIQGVVEK